MIMYDLFGGDYGQTTKRPTGTATHQAHFSACASGDARDVERHGDQKGNQPKRRDCAGTQQGDEGAHKEAQGGVEMFWKKQQPTPPVGLRMVTGDLSVNYDCILTITLNDVYWSGELISMHFDGFGIVNVRKCPYDSKYRLARLCVDYIKDGRYIEVSSYQYYANFVYLDALEREVRYIMASRFIAHGIDPKSYSLAELRFFEMAVKRGWQLRGEYEKAKRGE